MRLQTLLWVHFSPSLAFSIGEYVSQCFIPALLVLYFAVGVVAIPALSSPSLTMVAQPTIKLVRLVQYQQCCSVTRDLFRMVFRIGIDCNFVT
jgi:uncharacterized membrane protein (DUF106 family)